MRQREYKTITGLKRAGFQGLLDAKVLMATDSYLKKPFNNDEFWEIVKKALDEASEPFDGEKMTTEQIEQIIQTDNVIYWINGLKEHQKQARLTAENQLWHTAYLYKTISDKLNGYTSAMRLSFNSMRGLARIYYDTINLTASYIVINSYYDVLASEYGLKAIKDLKQGLSVLDQPLTSIEFEMLKESETTRTLNMVSSNNLNELDYLERRVQDLGVLPPDKVEQAYREIINIDIANIIKNIEAWTRKHSRWMQIAVSNQMRAEDLDNSAFVDDATVHPDLIAQIVLIRRYMFNKIKREGFNLDDNKQA